ncbi:hypothetical protein BJ166DRAFT_265415 [Pestalotiopsis sp. NC0098]|nr:hypothetical protein BJ166DRAFT_265415 [Pestalotiopsis sp. NC0098]
MRSILSPPVLGTLLITWLDCSSPLRLLFLANSPRKAKLGSAYRHTIKLGTMATWLRAGTTDCGVDERCCINNTIRARNSRYRAAPRSTRSRSGIVALSPYGMILQKQQVCWRLFSARQ